MSFSSTILRTSTVITLAAGGALPAAQTPAQPARDQQQPPIRRQANYVRVDVYPTKDGKPVLDLRAEDFQVFENDAPQAVSDFEHVVVTSAGPQSQRTDPGSVDLARQASANPRARVFVIFLDAKHVTIEGSWRIREPLVRLIDRILGPDDLVALMTPEMAPSQMTLARKTEVVEGGLRNAWPWGTRHTLHEDEKEAFYKSCYPPTPAEAAAGEHTSWLAKEMIARRAELLSLEALSDLVAHVGDLREERKAVLAVTEGWLLHRPSSEMMRMRDKYDIPGPDPIGVGAGGKIRSRETIDAAGGTTLYECNTDRMRLAQIDNDHFLRLIIDRANRANTSFYPVDPRGLAVFDNPIGPDRPPPLQVDHAMLRTRLEAMHTLAVGTDGLAVTTSNDLDLGLKRIADDLTSYYLLGYYTTNTKLDGGYRRISVRVKRPGVDVRARRGYRAPTEEEVRAARAAAEAEPVSAEAEAIAAARGALDRIRPDARFRLHAAPFAADGAVSIVWVAGELQAPPAGDPWTRGGIADIDVAAGGTTATARATLGPGERTFLVPVTLAKPAGDGTLQIRARLTGAEPDAARLVDSIQVPASAAAHIPLLFRRGPATGNRWLPAATFLFSRTERVRVEIPVARPAAAAAGRLIDRAGQATPVPVAVAARTDEAGRHWITADVTLAPLGAGDYTIEVDPGATSAAASSSKVFAAIRVVR